MIRLVVGVGSENGSHVFKNRGDYDNKKKLYQYTPGRSIRRTNSLEEVRDRPAKLAKIAGTDLPEEEGHNQS